MHGKSSDIASTKRCQPIWSIEMNLCSALDQLSSGSTRIGQISFGVSAPIKKRGLMNVLGKSRQVGASVGEAWGASMGTATDYLAPVSSQILFKLRACRIKFLAAKKLRPFWFKSVFRLETSPQRSFPVKAHSPERSLCLHGISQVLLSFFSFFA